MPSTMLPIFGHQSLTCLQECSIKTAYILQLNYLDATLVLQTYRAKFIQGEEKTDSSKRDA